MIRMDAVSVHLASVPEINRTIKLMYSSTERVHHYFSVYHTVKERVKGSSLLVIYLKPPSSPSRGIQSQPPALEPPPQADISQLKPV